MPFGATQCAPELRCPGIEGSARWRATWDVLGPNVEAKSYETPPKCLENWPEMHGNGRLRAMPSSNFALFGLEKLAGTLLSSRYTARRSKSSRLKANLLPEPISFCLAPQNRLGAAMEAFDVHNYAFKGPEEKRIIYIINV